MNYKYKEFVMAFTGYRGSTKTANAVFWCQDGMAHGVECHSNQPIKRTLLLPGGRFIRVQSIDLDYRKFLTSPQDFYRVLVMLDELQLLANSLRTTSNGNLLLQEMSTQIRKQEMSMIYTIQEMNWGDSRFAYQTDVEVECQDCAFLPWGMEEGLEQGELAICTYKDLTGIYTGRPYYKYAEAHTFMVNLKETVWGSYDTKNRIDESVARTQYIFEKEEVVVKRSPEGTYMETRVNADDVLKRFGSLVNQMAGAGYDRIAPTELWNACSDLNINSDTRFLGRLCKQFNLERRQFREGGIVKEYYLFPTHPKHSMNRESNLVGASK